MSNYLDLGIPSSLSEAEFKAPLESSAHVFYQDVASCHRALTQSNLVCSTALLLDLLAFPDADLFCGAKDWIQDLEHVGKSSALSYLPSPIMEVFWGTEKDYV